MALQRHPFRSSERPSTTKIADIGCSLPYTLHSALSLNVLLLMRHTSILAVVDPIYDLLHGIESVNIGDVKPSVRLPTWTPILVIVCIILPGSITSDSGTSSHEKVHLWVPSSRYHLSWCFCSLWNRSSWVLATVPGNQKHATYSRL